jgi:hypothetical protein
LPTNTKLLVSQLFTPFVVGFGYLVWHRFRLLSGVSRGVASLWQMSW